MNKKVFFGHNDLRFLYYRYKDSNYYSLLILSATIVVCMFLIFGFIIPQIQSYFSIREEVASLNSEIRTINENINFMNNLDKTLLNSQLQTATSALPSDKDFAGILNAIASAAIRSGVSVSDFSFRLDENSSSANGVKNGSPAGPLLINLSVDIKGSVSGWKKFLTEIYEKVPLVEITDIKGDSDSLTVGMRFYYKPLPKIAFKESEPITPVADSKQALIRKLSSWQSAPLNQEITVPVSSSSAVPLF